MSATHLKNLLKRIDELPLKTKHASQVKRLEHYLLKARTAREHLATATTGEAAVAKVFPDAAPHGTLPRVRDWTKQAARAARRLRAALAADLEEVTKPKSDKNLTELCEGAEKARQAARETWKDRLADKNKALMPLATVAQTAGLSGADALVQRLGDLDGAPLPRSDIEAEKIRVELEVIVTQLAGLGLKGAAWTFVVAAVRGDASARDLEQAEVREFLERHQLWKRLKVRLG